MAAGMALLAAACSAVAADPFANNNGQTPTGYSGPTFKLSHAYPPAAAVPTMPWRAAIGNGRITTANAARYAQALKDAVARDMRVLLFDYANWNAEQRGWYNEPWLGLPVQGSRCYAGREPIHGMYVGNEFPSATFPKSGLSKDVTTYVLTYYDRTAAHTLRKVWGASARTPRLTPASTQYAEGSLIVKAAFVTAGPDAWPVMQGAQVWPLYIYQNATAGVPASTECASAPAPKLTDTYLMQFDIIVKDSQSAPDTGWVFSTLVYDARVKPGANGIWDQMVVLGAQWGNDPQANSTTDPNAPLLQNWNNPAAPLYSTETLGWGGRLSGPNDGAVNAIAYKKGQTIEYVNAAPDSSCMSCHSTAQVIASPLKPPLHVKLLPEANFKLPPDKSDYLASPPPGSSDWLRWFQNRKGNVPMDKPYVAADFDMVLAFKSLPYWWALTRGQQHTAVGADKRGLLAPASDK
jgi:hypothetical protein